MGASFSSFNSKTSKATPVPVENLPKSSFRFRSYRAARRAGREVALGLTLQVCRDCRDRGICIFHIPRLDHKQAFDSCVCKL